jgi:hypothetical protein
MKNAFRLLPAIALAAALGFTPQPSFANCGHNGKDVGNGCAKGAPAPLIGAGLPGLAAGLGYGAYLLARRRRRNVG